MLLTSPPILQFKSLSLTTPFLHGTTPTTHLLKPATSSVARPSYVGLPVIKAEKPIHGRVVCSTNDKTVSVLVIRSAPHPKYKRIVRYKKKFQAHDPLNQFNVGDYVQLNKCRPISKTKAFWAVPIPERIRGETKIKDKKASPLEELGIPLESEV